MLFTKGDLCQNVPAPGLAGRMICSPGRVFVRRGMPIGGQTRKKAMIFVMTAGVAIPQRTNWLALRVEKVVFSTALFSFEIIKISINRVIKAHSKIIF